MRKVNKTYPDDCERDYGCFPMFEDKETIDDNGSLIVHTRQLSQKEILQRASLPLPKDLTDGRVSVPTDYQSVLEKIDELNRRVDEIQFNPNDSEK